MKIYATRLLVWKGGSMSKPGTTAVAQPTDSPAKSLSPKEVLLKAYTDLRDDLISTLWFVLGNQEDAQDMAQEAFYRCWRSLDTQPDILNLRAWIFRVGLNAAKDLQRSAYRRRVKPIIEDETLLPMADDAPVGQELENQETLLKLTHELLKLRPEEQEVFLLRQNGELTYEQIAEIQHRPVGTVKTHMRNALQKLRKVLA